MEAEVYLGDHVRDAKKRDAFLAELDEFLAKYGARESRLLSASKLSGKAIRSWRRGAVPSDKSIAALRTTMAGYSEIAAAEEQKAIERIRDRFDGVVRVFQNGIPWDLPTGVSVSVFKRLITKGILVSSQDHLFEDGSPQSYILA